MNAAPSCGGAVTGASRPQLRRLYLPPYLLPRCAGVGATLATLAGTAAANSASAAVPAAAIHS